MKSWVEVTFVCVQYVYCLYIGCFLVGVRTVDFGYQPFGSEKAYLAAHVFYLSQLDVMTTAISKKIAKSKTNDTGKGVKAYRINNNKPKICAFLQEYNGYRKTLTGAYKAKKVKYHNKHPRSSGGAKTAKKKRQNKKRNNGGRSRSRNSGKAKSTNNSGGKSKSKSKIQNATKDTDVKMSD